MVRRTRKTHLAGIDVKIVPQQDLDEAAQKEGLLIGAMRIEDAMPGTVVAGSTQTICDSCGFRVWLSPATKNSIPKEGKSMVMCMRCIAMMADEKL